MALGVAPVRASSEISRPRCKSVANYWVKTGVILSVLTSDLRLRNALDYLPRKADDDCRQELRWLYDRRNLKEAQQDLQAWLTRWATRYPKLTDWVEAHIGETVWQRREVQEMLRRDRALSGSQASRVSSVVVSPERPRCRGRMPATHPGPHP